MKKLGVFDPSANLFTNARRLGLSPRVADYSQLCEEIRELANYRLIDRQETVSDEGRSLADAELDHGEKKWVENRCGHVLFRAGSHCLGKGGDASNKSWI